MLKCIWTSQAVEGTSEWHGCAGSTSDPAVLALEESKPAALAGEDAIWVSLVLHSRGKVRKVDERSISSAALMVGRLPGGGVEESWKRAGSRQCVNKHK